MAVLGRYIDALKASKRCISLEWRVLYRLLVAWNRCLLLQKPQLHLYRSQIIDPKPKGRQPLFAFALLFAAIVLFVRKSSYNLSDISIISPFWLALEAWGESAGILKNSFGLLLTASWRDIKRSSIDFSLLASPKFLYRELAGGPPCRCCFNSATQNGVGQNRLLQRRGERNKPKKFTATFSHSFLEMFSEPDKFEFVVFVKSLVIFTKAVPAFLLTLT